MPDPTSQIVLALMQEEVLSASAQTLHTPNWQLIVHTVSTEQVAHSVVDADGSCLPSNHLREHLATRDRVRTGNARIEIACPRANTAVAGRIAISAHALIANRFEQLLGSEGLLQERGVDRNRVHRFARHNDDVHLWVSATSILSEFGA